MMTSWYLSSLEFRRSCSTSVQTAARQEDAEQFQRLMLNQQRTARRRLEKLMQPATSAVLWSSKLLAESDMDRELSLLPKSRGRRRRAFRQLLENIQLSGGSPISLLAAAESLLVRGESFSATDFATLYCRLAQLVRTQILPDTPDEGSKDVRTLVCAGEIPWILSLLTGDLKGAQARRTAAARVLRQGLEAATDTDGMLHADLVSQADQWLAPFVRATLWGDAFGKRWTTDADRERLQDTVCFCVTLVVPGGLVTRPPENPGGGDATKMETMEHAVRCVGLRNSAPESALIQSLHRGKRATKGSRTHQRKSASSNQSDWAEAALLRSALTIDADTALITWPNADVRIHLAVLGTPLLSGSWQSYATVNGKMFASENEWTCSCWFVDEEAAFLELESELGESDVAESVRLVRHVMLSMEDRSAVICESASCSDAEAEIEFESRLPLTANPLAVTNSITRDVVLHAGCVSTRVIPAWLEDDRLQHAMGTCEKHEEALVSTARGRGGVTVPVVLDWHPERLAQDADWTRLTVTERRRPSGGQQAAGFRVRVGRQQLLIYRSLQTSEVPRAVLGMHTSNETVYGRVKKSGEVAPLVLVESPE